MKQNFGRVRRCDDLDEEARVHPAPKPLRMSNRYYFLLAPIVLCFVLISMGFSPTVLPPGAMSPYLNGTFSAIMPGEGGSWDIEDVFPGDGFQGPVRIVAFPRAEEGIVILGKRGQAWLADPVTQDTREIMNISDRILNGWEGGSLGIAFHPDFNQGTQEVFVYYRWKENPAEFTDEGYQRLSRFTWDDTNQRVDANSEEVLIQQYDRKSWHAGGGMFFDPDGFLFLSIGDEGFTSSRYEDSNQRLDKGLLGGLLRIDVDNDPERSHPIRRQPQHPGPAPEGWPESFSQGYMIPNDNPWLDESGESLEEFAVMGTRSPHAVSFDEETNTIWVADVGANSFEEISRASIGDNLEWPWKEGNATTSFFEKPENVIGRETAPYIAYPRDVGASVMGGSVYRGEVFPSLHGKYLFADWVTNRIMAVEGSTSEPEIITLIGSLTNLPHELPESAKISGVYPQPDGDILITVMGPRSSEGPGKIYRLVKRNPVADPPSRLSETGAFIDLINLDPAAGIIPYQTNAQLYSDGAVKQRWMAVPNDGDHDTPEEQIVFHEDSEWEFPEGTVLIKHFEMPNSLAAPERTIRLETRFFIVGINGTGYGLTYRWNEEGTEAFLLNGAEERYYEFFDEQDQVIGTATWSYPSRVQCLTCHTANAGYVLGVNTHQLNGPLTYPSTGLTMNQLTYLADVGVLSSPVGAVTALPRAYALADETASLDTRVWSYLDANCAGCHRPGGLAHVDMDLRFGVNDNDARRIFEATKSHSSNSSLNIVEPGDHQRSELWVRDASEESRQMPPLGRSMRDEKWVATLAEWIDGLLLPTDVTSEFKVYPNPASGWVEIALPSASSPPFQFLLHDVSGRLLHRFTTEEAERVTLNLEEYPSGVLLLTIIDQAGKQWVERVVKR